MLLSSDTKLTPYQLRELNRLKWESIHGSRKDLKRQVAKYLPIDRGVLAHGEGPKSALNWSKHRNSSDVLPRALRNARAHKFIDRTS